MRQELTAPVSAIVGYAEILREDASEYFDIRPDQESPGDSKS